MTETKRYEGGCQCGALRYEITAAPLVLYLCHCSECQTQSGSAFGMSLAVPSEAFSMRSGTPKTWARSSASGYGVDCAFCADCGVRIFHRPERKPGTIKREARHAGRHDLAGPGRASVDRQRPALDQFD